MYQYLTITESVMMASDPDDHHDATENSPLLSEQSDNGEGPKPSPSLTRVLPLALIASIGVHMTAASTVFVYASLFCVHPQRCKDAEQRQFAGSVATATALANIAGLVSLGYLERLIQTSTRVGLTVWFGCRGLGVLGLTAGGTLQCRPIWCNAN